MERVAARHGVVDNPKSHRRRIQLGMVAIKTESCVVSVLGRSGAGTDTIGRGVLRKVRVKDLADEALVRRVAEVRDEGALSELYDRYAAVILGAGVRFLGDRGAAEDLLQDVFVSVWRSAGSFDDSRVSFATWIHRVTRNRATDLVRRRRARVKTIPVSSAFEPGEEDSTNSLSRNFDVAAALWKLSPTHREILTLAYFEGLSQREISSRTGTPLGTVKSRTTAALRALRTHVARPNESPADE